MNDYFSYFSGLWHSAETFGFLALPLARSHNTVFVAYFVCPNPLSPTSYNQIPLSKMTNKKTIKDCLI